MALTTEQQASRLYKKLFGNAETLVSREFFNESYGGRTFVLPSQIWSDEDSISTTAPILTNGQISGVVQYFDKLELSHIPGSLNQSYYHENLKDAIPFNFGDGTYNYKLYKNDGTTVISAGEGEWLVDTEAGVLTFYPRVDNPLPSGVNLNDPPKISFYKYVGEKGIKGSGSGTIIVKDPVDLATTSIDIIGGYDINLSGFTSIPDTIDGVSGNTLVDGDRILIKDQIDKVQNGIYEVSDTTLVRASDSNGIPEGEVNTSNYVFVFSGNENANSSWLLSDTDAEDPTIIIPGVNTQIWKLFSESRVYTTDGQAIQLFNTEFKLILDESGLGSGLEQSVDGLRVTRELLGTISGITSLESIVISGFTSIEHLVENIDMSSIENAIISGDTSLEDSITSLKSDFNEHTHDKLYTPDGQDVIVYTDNEGRLHIDADIIQSGSTYETHIEQLYTKKDHIILREDSVSPLGDPTNISGLTGLIADNFDGSGDKGLLVFDSGGTARVGHWDGTDPIDLNDIQPLATRIENPDDGKFAYWDAINKRLDFKTLDSEGIGIIGTPDDGDYSDGLFTDFTSGTTVANAIDSFNEILLLLAPSPPRSWDNTLSNLNVTQTKYSPRQLSTGTVVNNVITSTTPTLTISSTVGLAENARETNATFTLIDSGVTIETNTIDNSSISKTSGYIRYNIGDPYDGVSGKAGFWKGVTSFSLTSNLPSITASSNQRELRLEHTAIDSPELFNYYVDSPLSVTIGTISATIPNMSSYISGVPTLTSTDTITSVGFNINNVSSYFYAPSYVWEAEQNLISSKNGNPDDIPTSYGETGVVTNETLNIRNGVFSDTSFSFRIRGRNSTSTSGGWTTYSVSDRRVDTVSNESIRKTSGTGQYPSTNWGGTYDSSESLLLNQELQLLNGRYIYPTTDYTTQGGPDYSTASGIRWVTFTHLGSLQDHSSFTLDIIGSQNITNILQSGLYIEIKISGTTYWVNGNASYDNVSNPGSVEDGTPALVFGASTATSRRITFGTPVYTGTIVVRIGISEGSNISFTGLNINPSSRT